MNFFIKTRPSPILWAIALAGMVIACGAVQVSDYDIWWHLKTGEVIWSWRMIPTYDIFSYSAAGAPWVNHEWLFQVFAWLVYNSFGIVSLTILKVALCAILAYALFRTFSFLTDSQSAALFGTLIALWGSADRILERPHLFSMVFIAIYCLVLHKFAGGKSKNIWILIPLQVLWVNIHGGGILGPQIILAFALGETLQAIAQRFFQNDRPPEPALRERRRQLWLVGFACIAASLINPGGIDIFLFPASHLKMDAILSYTQEWLPALDPRIDFLTTIFIFRLTFVVVMISYIVNRKNARISHILITVIFSALVLKGKRFAPEFIIANLPIVFFNLKGVARRIPITPGLGFAHAWANILLISMLSIFAVRHGIPITLKGEFLDQMGFGVHTQNIPIEMADFLEESKIHGRVFNDMGLGGYLIFRRWPGELVFIDGRTPVYGDDFYRNFVDAFHRSANFEELNSIHNFDYLVFKHDGAWDMRHFHKYLWDSGKWNLVFADSEQGLIYVRKGPMFKNVIKKFGMKKHSLIEEMKSVEAKSKNAGPKHVK